MADASTNTVGSSTVNSLRGLTSTQQALLGGVFVAVIGAVVLVGRMGGSTSMGILYSDLEPGTAASVVDELESRGIPYELSDAGRVVWVPRQQVATTRLNMSAAGLPDSADGWSILDNQGITSSDFDQRVGYQRAMEGELASTISVIDGVVSANVHLVIPEQDLFVDDDIKASASVLLQTDGSNSIAPTQVQAIVNLVASSIEGLSATDVTVTDDMGRLLAGGDEDAIAGVESDNQTRQRNAFESDVEAEIETLLNAVVGSGRSVATVTADLDFDRVVQTQETYDEPLTADGATLPRGEKTRTERYGTADDTTEGALTIETEILDGVAADTGASGGYILDERDVDYAVNSVITSTETAPGAIRSMSIAVVIDEAVLPAERLAEIQTMVSAAVGADEERGDLIEVSLLPFDVSVEEQEAAALEAGTPVAAAAAAGSSDLIRVGAASALGLVVLVGGIFMLRRASRRTVIDSIDLESLPVGSVELGDGPDQSATTPQLGPATEATETDLLELVANQPDDIAAVLRQWLSQPESAQ